MTMWNSAQEQRHRQGWVTIQSSSERSTLTLAVPGGTLYLVIESAEMGSILSEHLVFAPAALKPPKS